MRMAERLCNREDGERSVLGVVCPLCQHPLVTDGTHVWCTHYATQLYQSQKEADASCEYGVLELVRLASLPGATIAVR
jgi:hypothetical protein